MDFYRHSNTHDPDQDGFEDLYHRDFIYAISRVARRKLARHHLDPYQYAAFRCGIVHHNMGEEEVNPTLELAMEYAGARGTIIFDESCRLRDLTEAQVGRNQFTVDIVVDQLDGEADHAAERIGVRESPPPTPREAYLPQRPERTQKEGGIRDEIDPSPSRSKSSQDKAETPDR